MFALAKTRQEWKKQANKHQKAIDSIAGMQAHVHCSIDVQVATKRKAEPRIQA